MAAPPKRRPSGSSRTDAPSPVRLAHSADVSALVTLERRCFSDPWTAASFREAVDASWSFGLVSEAGGELVGYLIAREAAGTGEILNLAVAPEHRRAGLARQLLDAGMAALAARGVTEVFLEVRESNLAAQSLYADAGFRAVGHRPAYYRSPKEDALVLRRELAPEAKR